MRGQVGILNVGAGDTKLSFDPSDPALNALGRSPHLIALSSLPIAEACFKYNRRNSKTAFNDSVRMFVGAAS